MTKQKGVTDKCMPPEYLQKTIDKCLLEYFRIREGYKRNKKLVSTLSMYLMRD